MPDDTPQPDPQLLQRRQEHLDAVTALRQHGYTWDQVNQYYAGQVGKLRGAGYNEGQISAYYGGQDPAPVVAGVQERTAANVQAGQPKGLVDAFVDGLTNSSTAALLGHAGTPDTPGEGQGAAISHAFGETIGDLPVAIPSALFTGRKVAAAAQITPVVGEIPGAPEAAGAVAGSFNAAAVPELIKSERDAWTQAHNQGWSVANFLGLQGQVAQNTITQGAVGAVTGGVGSVAEKALVKAGVSTAARVVGKLGAEAATFTAAQAAVAGKMPSTQDLVDGTVLLAAFHVAGVASSSVIRGYRGRLQQHYVETGQNPIDAAQQAKYDPVLRRQLMGGPNPPARPGSARSDVDPPARPQPGHLPDPGAPPTEQHVTPRAIGSFDEAAPWILKEEGGLTTDTGGLTKYGISSKANPDIDVAHLSKEQALELYHTRYWKAIDADSLAPNMRLAAFDSAVNEGVGATKAWLKESGGDIDKFMALRAAKYAELARDPKYAPYAKAWARRLRDLGASGGFADLVGNGPSHTGEELSPDEKTLLDHEGEPPEDEPPKPPQFGEPGDEDGQHWDRVMARVAPTEGVDLLSGSIEATKRVYGELFDPDHPIRKLVDSVTKGDDLDDARNPEFLRRIAENTDEIGKYTVERKMVDLDGNETGPGLKEIVQGVGDKKAQSRFLDGYAIAKWAVMMDDQNKKTGVDINDARKVVAEGSPQFSDAFDKLVTWRNGTLKWLAEGGIHPSDKVDALIKDNEASIPGYRRMDDGTYGPVSSGKSGIWNPIKTAQGSERLVEPILKSLMQDAFLRHALAVHNRANVSLADLAIEGNKAKERRAVDINVVQALDDLRQAGIKSGSEENPLDDIASNLARSTGASIGKDQVPMFRDGKLYGVKFEDPEVTRVLRGYDQAGQSTVMKIAAAVTSVPRNLQTRLNPLFPIKLLTYDVPWQFISNPDSKGAVQNLYTGISTMLTDPDLYHQWMRSGGAERVFSGLSKNRYMQEVMKGTQQESLAAGAWNLVKTPFHALTSWTQMVSTPMRLGRYVRGLDQGESPQRAAVASTEAAFHRPGYGGPVGKAWNTIMPYLTAHLNGLEKTVRSQFGIGRTVTGVAYNAAAFTAKAAAVLTLPALAQWWFNKDEPWYKAAPDWQKDNGFFIPTPGGGHAFVAAPPLISAIYVGLPRRLMEGFFHDNPHAFDGFERSLGASLAPPGGLTVFSILQPIIEHMANYSFFRDQPLANPDTVKGVGSAEQFNHYSSGTAKTISRFVNDIPIVQNMRLSPIVIDNYIRTWGGDWGQAATRAADVAANVGKANQPPAMSFSDWPGVSSWSVRYPSASAQPITDYYNRAEALDKVHGSIMAAIKDGDLARVRELANKDPSAAAYHAARLQDEPSTVDLSPYLDVLNTAADKADYQDVALIKQGEAAMKQASVYANKVWENPALSAQDKRQILDQTYATMQVMAGRITDAMDRAHINGSKPSRKAASEAPEDIGFQPPVDQ